MQKRFDNCICAELKVENIKRDFNVYKCELEAKEKLKGGTFYRYIVCDYMFYFIQSDKGKIEKVYVAQKDTYSDCLRVDCGKGRNCYPKTYYITDFSLFGIDDLLQLEILIQHSIDILFSIKVFFEQSEHYKIFKEANKKKNENIV